MTVSHLTTKRSRLVDLSNRVFGRLVVVSRADNDTQGKSQWLCRCTCGATKIVRSYSLRKGITTSCGCFMLEQNGINRPRRRGLVFKDSNHPCYNSWMAMIRRCTEPKYHAYNRYGGRGISVCDRWLDSFSLFCLDMGDKPSPSHSIDRIDNNGDYTPTNCRWATPSEQRRNQRRSICLVYEGAKYSLEDLAQRLNVNRGTLYSRCQKTIKGGFPQLPDGSYSADVLLQHPITPRHQLRDRLSYSIPVVCCG